MEMVRKRNLIAIWSLLTGGSILIFWTIWYLKAGEVPVVTRMAPHWPAELPFGISRWWDILIGPIWSTIFIILFTSEKIRENENLAYGLGLGLFTGFFLGLAGSLIDPILFLAAFVFALALLLGFQVLSPISGLSFGLAFSLGFGLILALGLGVVQGIVYMLLSVLISSMLIILKHWRVFQKFLLES